MIYQVQQNETRVLIKARPQNPKAFLALHSAYMRPGARVNNTRYSGLNFRLQTHTHQERYIQRNLFPHYL